MIMKAEYRHEDAKILTSKITTFFWGEKYHFINHKSSRSEFEGCT